MAKTTRYTGSFRATAGKSGQQVTIRYWTQYADASDNESDESDPRLVDV